MVRGVRTQTVKSSILEVVKAHPTWFTISAIGFILIFGVVAINDPSKWWIGLLVAAGLSLLIFTAINGRVVLKAIGSVFVLAATVAGASMMGAYVMGSPFYGLAWPSYQIAVYLAALAFSYIAYSGRGRWSYLGMASLGQFALTSLLLIIGAEPYLSAIVGGAAALLGFVLIYLLNGRTRISKEMPPSAFTADFAKAVAKGAEDLALNIRVVPPRGNLGSHLIIYGEQSVILYPIEMNQPFGLTGRKLSQLGYQSKPINPWLLNLSYATSPAWKAKGASPVLVLVDVERKNGSEGKIIGVSLPDSKKRAVVGVLPAPALRSDRGSYGSKLLLSAFKLVENYSDELTAKQKKALGKVGLNLDEITDFQNNADISAEKEPSESAADR